MHRRESCPRVIKLSHKTAPADIQKSLGCSYISWFKIPFKSLMKSVCKFFHDSSVGIVTRLRGGQFDARQEQEIFSVLQNAQTVYGAQPPLSTGVLSSGGNAAGVWSWPLTSMLYRRMNGVISLPPYAIMAWQAQLYLSLRPSYTKRSLSLKYWYNVYAFIISTCAAQLCHDFGRLCWLLTPCRLVLWHLSFEGICCLHLHGRITLKNR